MWFILAILAPVLWAIVNHADKYLLSKYFKVDGVGSLMIFSTLFGAFVLPVALYFDDGFFTIGLENVSILIISGICNAVAIILYLYALQDDEASIVVPFYQTIPIFGYFLGYFLFNENLTSGQMLAALVILIGTFILSLNLEKGKAIFKWKIIILMLLSSFIFASYEALFKFVAIQDSFWIAVFWEHVGLFLFGAFLFIFISKYRIEFVRLIQKNSKLIISINLGSEVLTIVGNLLTNIAILMAPLVMVLLVSAYQPLFVFIFGVILTLFFPKIGQERMERKYMIQKILSLIIIFVGSYLLYIQ